MMENKQLIKRIFDQKGCINRQQLETDYVASRNYAAIRKNFKPKKELSPPNIYYNQLNEGLMHYNSQQALASIRSNS